MTEVLDLATALSSALRTAPSIPLPVENVWDCIDSHNARAADAEAQFRRAFASGLAAIPIAQRAHGLNGVTGHVAESVVEMILAERGWTPLEHFEGPFSGGHGVDLAMATPGFDNVVVIEVKGTLTPRRWPRLAKGELPQLGKEWLQKIDNPAVSSLGMVPADLAVLAVLVQFGRRELKVAWSRDGTTVISIADLAELA